MPTDRLIIPVSLDWSKLDKDAEKVRNALKTLGVSQQEIDKVGRKVTKSVQEQEKAFQRLEQRLDPAVRKADQYRRALEILNARRDAGRLSAQRHAQLVQMAATSYGQATTRLGALIRNLGTLKGALAAAGFTVATAQLARMGRALFDAELQMQRIQARLRIAAGGGSAEGGALFKAIASDAKRLGLGLEQTATAFSGFGTAARLAGLSVEDARRIFLGAATASAAMGLSTDDTAHTLLAFEQMLNKGTVRAEELVRQLSNSLPGGLQIAARSMNVTTAELMKMVQAGQVAATDLLPRLARELVNTFGGEASKNVERLTGATGNLSTAWFELKAEMADGGLLVGVVNALRTLIEWANRGAQAENRLAEAARRARADMEGLGNTSFGRVLSYLFGLGSNRQNVDTSVYGPTQGGGNLDARSFVQANARYTGPNAFYSPTSTGLIENIPDIGKLEKDAENAAKALKKVRDRIDEIFQIAARASMKKSIAASILDPKGMEALLKTLTEAEAIRKRGAQLTAQMMTDEEKRSRAISDALYLYQQGVISAETMNRVMAENRDQLGQIVTETDRWHQSLLKVIDTMYEMAYVGSQIGSVLSDLGIKAGSSIQRGSNLIGQIGGLFETYQKVGGAAMFSSTFFAYVGGKIWEGFEKSARKRREWQIIGTATAAVSGGALYGQFGAGPAADVSKTILGVLSAFQDATGVFIREMEQIAIGIRRNGRLTLSIVDAVRTAILRSELSSSLPEQVTRYLQSLRIPDEDSLIRGVKLITEILDEFSGLSGIELTLQRLPQQIAAIRQELISLGVSAQDAADLSYKYGVNQLLGVRRQITGEQLTPAQELAQRKQQAQLFNAQVALMRAELMARKSYLQARIAAARGESRLLQGEIETFRGYIGARGKLAQANVDIMNAELAAINAVLKALENIEIDIGKLKIKGLGKIKIGGGTTPSASDYWETLLGPQSALSPANQLSAAKTFFEQELAKGSSGDIETARRLYLQEAQTFYGSTAAYTAIFEDVMRRTASIGSLSQAETQNRLKAIQSLSVFSSAAIKAASAMATLGGFSLGSIGGSKLSSGGQTDSLNTLLRFPTGGRDNSDLISAITGGNSSIVEVLQQVGTVIEKSTRTGGGSTPTSGVTPPPPPPPPPSGGVSVFSGGGGIVRSY